MRLPILTSPIEDETWASYLTRAAANHGVSTAALGEHLGLRAKGHWVSGYGIFIEADAAAKTARGLGIAQAAVEEMQLSHYDGRAFDLSELRQHPGLAGARRVARQHWIFVAGSRYCPACLEDDGAWRLSWRLPWITCCPRHELRLCWLCPSCGQIPGVYGATHASVPQRTPPVADTARCDLYAQGGHCGAVLTTAPTMPAQVQTLVTSARLASIIEAGEGTFAGTTWSAPEVLRGYQSAISLAAHLGIVGSEDWGRTHRWTSPPRDPAVLDGLLSIVSPVARASDPGAAAHVIGTWCAQAGVVPSANTFDRSTQVPAAMRKVVQKVLSQHGRALTRAHRLGVQGVLPLTDWSVADVPQVVWPCALPAVLRNSTKPNALLLRAVVSLLLVGIVNGGSWERSGERLGFPPGKGNGWGRYAVSRRFGLREQLLKLVQDLAPFLPLQPQRAAWAERPPLSENVYGLGCLADAQRPSCRSEDESSAWCPCTGTRQGRG